MSKKLVYFIDNFYPNVDGVIKVVNNYGKILSKDNDCTVIVPDYRDGYKGKHEYRLLRKSSHLFKFHDFIFPLPKRCKVTDEFLKNHQADVYHAHSPFFLGHYALKQAKKHHVPVVATFHSQFKRDFLEQTHSRLMTFFLMRYVMKFFNKCDEVWAVSNATANTLRSYGYKKPIYIARNGTAFVYPENMEELKQKVKKQYNIDANKKNLAFVGQIRMVKNLKLIVDTLELLSKERNDFHFYFIGEGNDEKKLKKYVHKKGLDNVVTFTGKLAGGDMMQGMFANTDLMFFPSIYDNSSIAVQEACVCRVPTLFVEGSNTSEGFTDCKTGYLAKEDAVAMKDKLVYILDHDKERQEVGLRASKEMPHTWEEVVLEAATRYETVIKNYKEKHQK